MNFKFYKLLKILTEKPEIKLKVTVKLRFGC